MIDLQKSKTLRFIVFVAVTCLKFFEGSYVIQSICTFNFEF